MRRSRAGFSLVEVVLASAVLATSMVTVMGLISWTRRVAAEAAKRELAQTVATDTMTRLSGEPFERLVASYGPGTHGGTDPRRDPLLRQATSYMANESGAGTLEVRADFRPLPDGPGYLQVSVSYPLEGDRSDNVVMSRLLPTPATSSYSLESGPNSLVKRAAAPLGTSVDASPAARASDQLFFSLLKKMAGSPAAAFLDMAMTADRRDHKYDLDWSRVVNPTLEDADQWKAIERALGGDGVPDGVYDLTEDRFERSGRIATLWTLRDMNDRERFVVQIQESDARRIGEQPARELGAYAISGLVGQDAAAPREPSSARITATSSRVWMTFDRFDANGSRVPFARRLGVFSAPEEMDPFAPSASLYAFLPKAARLSGLALEPRKISAAAAHDEVW